MKKFSLVFLFLFFFTLSAYSNLSVKGFCKQGGFLILKIDNEKLLDKVVCNFLGNSYKLVKLDNSYITYIPINLNAPIGFKTLVVKIYLKDKLLKQYKRYVKIKKLKKKKQYLHFSKSTENKYSYKGIDKELNLIDKALHTYTDKNYLTPYFVWPVKGYISTQFAQERYVNGKFFSYHKGIDIAAEYGKNVKAINNGKVVLSRKNFILHGKTIIIDHGLGLTSLYIHLSKILVKEGDFVKKGQVIGKVGCSGACLGPHLHFGLYIDRVAINPLIIKYWNGKL